MPSHQRGYQQIKVSLEGARTAWLTVDVTGLTSIRGYQWNGLEAYFVIQAGMQVSDGLSLHHRRVLPV